MKDYTAGKQASSLSLGSTLLYFLYIIPWVCNLLPQYRDFNRSPHFWKIPKVKHGSFEHTYMIFSRWIICMPYSTCCNIFQLILACQCIYSDLYSRTFFKYNETLTYQPLNAFGFWILLAGSTFGIWHICTNVIYLIQWHNLCFQREIWNNYKLMKIALW
jgi:hypothetical protein